MSLRRKILLLIGITLVALMAGMYAIASRILLQGFHWLEESEARKNVQRALNTVNDELASLRAVSADPELWTDARLTESRLNLVMLVNAAGQVTQVRGFDYVSQQFRPVAEGARQALVGDGAWLRGVGAGVVLMPEGAMLVAGRPVASEKEAAGRVVVGRYLTAAEIQRLSQRAQLSFTALRIGEGHLPAEFRSARDELQGRARVYVHSAEGKILAGYTVMRDVHGKPALLFRVEMPREIHTQGQVTIGYLVSALLVVGLVFGVVAVVMLEGLVLGRLARVIGAVRAIGASGNFAARLPATGNDDELSGLVVAINRMVGALQESHEKLAESQRQLATLISNLPGFVYRCRNDRDWTMEFVSDGCRRVTGYASEDLVGNQRLAYNELIHPEDRERVWEEVQAAIRERRLFQLFYRIRTLTAEERWVWDVGSTVFSADGALLALEGYVGDVTEQRRAEAQLRLQGAALAAAANAIVITDRNGHVTWVNPAFTQLTGYAAAEVVGQTPRALKSGKHGAAFYADLWQTILAGKVWRGELVNRRKDGSLYTERMTITPVSDASGAVTHFIAIKEDVSEQQRLQEQLLQAQKMEAVGRLAGGVAHDFNNMLTAIMGYSELIMRQLKDDTPLRHNAAEIERAAYRAAKLTRQLLAFSRKQVLQPRDLSLNRVFVEMEKMLRRLIPENIELRQELTPSLGTVHADPGQVEQVILNLVINARDAMPAGGVLTIGTANVTLTEPLTEAQTELAPGEYVLLTVRDTGTGMTAEVLEHIFEPFFTTKAQNDGTGLGLATCYGIVKQSGGHISVESQPGKGSTFRVYLPRVAAAAETDAKLAAMDTMPRGNETVLLVEDEDTVRELAGVVLSDLGYTVLSASNGVEALKVAAQRDRARLDLLLTDMVMPQMDGKDLAEALRRLRPGLRVLFCSGYSEDAVIRSSVAAPGTAFLQKPYTPGVLARKVREVLDAS